MTALMSEEIRIRTQGCQNQRLVFPSWQILATTVATYSSSARPGGWDGEEKDA